MKKIILIITLASMSNLIYAESCLSAKEKKKVDSVYKRSGDFYGYIKIQCEKTSLKKFCADPYNVKMANILIRMDVYDEENATKTEIRANQLHEQLNQYQKELAKSNCQKIKKNFFNGLETSTWNNY